MKYNFPVRLELNILGFRIIGNNSSIPGFARLSEAIRLLGPQQRHASNDFPSNAFGS